MGSSEEDLNGEHLSERLTIIHRLKTCHNLDLTLIQTEMLPNEQQVFQVRMLLFLHICETPNEIKEVLIAINLRAQQQIDQQIGLQIDKETL
jgi:hypothetical protein